MILHDYYCPDCFHTRRDVLASAPPRHCGVPMRVDWSHGKPPATDLGSPRRYEGLDVTVSSTRQAERVAKQRAQTWTNQMQDAGKNMSWTIDGVAGDKRGGARDVRRLAGSAFSYGKQGSRVSTGER